MVTRSGVRVLLAERSIYRKESAKGNRGVDAGVDDSQGLDPFLGATGMEDKRCTPSGWEGR